MEDRIVNHAPPDWPTNAPFALIPKINIVDPPSVRRTQSSIENNQSLAYLTTPNNLPDLPAPWGSGLAGKSIMQNKPNGKIGSHVGWASAHAVIFAPLRLCGIPDLNKTQSSSCPRGERPGPEPVERVEPFMPTW